MKVFGDAVYFVALLSARDRWHAHARAINQNPPGPLVTTEWILTEVGDAFSQPAMRQKFIQLLHLLTHQPDVEIAPLIATCFDEGVEFYGARPDKERSLTDCISFVVMKELGIADSLTSDRHFEQAGFRILLKEYLSKSACWLWIFSECKRYAVYYIHWHFFV